MSTAVAEGCFLSALQPNSSRTAYVVPSDGPSPDPMARARRVREQVRIRLAEKRSSSLPRLNDSVGSTDNSASEFKSSSHVHGFSSSSMTHKPSRVIAVPTVSHHSSGFSSYSAVESSSHVRNKGSNVIQCGLQTSQSHSSNRRSKSLCQEDERAYPLTVLVPSETASFSITANSPCPQKRCLSGTLAKEEPAYQYIYKGPSHRTISRITNRQQHCQQQSSAVGHEGWVGTGRRVPTVGDGWGTQWQQHVTRDDQVPGTGHYQASLHRAASLRSVRSVGKGLDVLDVDSLQSNNPLQDMIQGLDMATAVRYLSESDPALQVVGGAYIQHHCYHSSNAKNQVRALHGIPALVQLFSSDNQEVQRYATGAMQNLIYENTDNKTALVNAGGVMQLVNILNQTDEELRKTVTGVLWNLSSKDNLKEKLSNEALTELTEQVLIPLCRSIPLSPPERDIFNNTTGCLRNLSSVNERTRQKMRDMLGLVESLVCYIQQEERADDKGLENSLCVMRNLSYQLYMELPTSVRLRLEGPKTASGSRGSDAIGCFSLYSKKKNEHNQSLSVLSEVSRQPNGSEWLWHPKVVGLYKLVLQNGYSNSVIREAAIGALQNITAGESRWCSVLSCVVIDQEKMMPILLDLLDTHSDSELRPLTGLLRNLVRNYSNKDHMARVMVNILVSKLPSDGLQKKPSSEVVVNICGTLNHLVTVSSLAAHEISHFDGLPKLVGIKTSHDNSYGSLKSARAASTVLCNMFQYSKLHKDYRLKGFSRRDLTDVTL
ncbi:plakophilin-3-like [Notolabrus celidotus]|uniref:plakophilin-3-like n=1 Tax=Notolabrus celidotus TaxID=1203425 RepID=UPI00148F62D3|nr:plakophilin-3-like [Notolabrus celidotus]